MRIKNCLRAAAVFLLALGMLVIPTGCLLQTQSTGPTVLRIAYRPAVADLKPLLDAYERDHPGVTIEVFESTGTNFPSLSSELQAGKLDIVREYRGTMGTLVRSGAFEVLDGMLESGDWAKIKPDYFNGAWEGLQYDGKQFGVPAGLDMYVAYANLDIFEAADVPPPLEDWTVDDLLTAASLVNQPEGRPDQGEPVVYGFGTYYQSADPIIFTYLHGGSLVDDFDNPATAYFDDPRTIEAVTWYRNLLTEYKLSPRSSLVTAYFSYAGIYSAQAQGYCALWFGLFSGRGGQSGGSQFGAAQADGWDFKWKMLPLPQDVQPMSIGDVDGYYIPANSAHQQEALKLVRYLADQWQTSGSRFPARKSLAENPRYQAQVGEDIARMGALAAENLVVMPAYYGARGGQLLGEFFSALYQIIDKGDDPQMMLEQTQQTVTTWLMQRSP